MSLQISISVAGNQTLAFQISNKYINIIFFNDKSSIFQNKKKNKQINGIIIKMLKYLTIGVLSFVGYGSITQFYQPNIAPSFNPYPQPFVGNFQDAPGQDNMRQIYYGQGVIQDSIYQPNMNSNQAQFTLIDGNNIGPRQYVQANIQGNIQSNNQVVNNNQLINPRGEVNQGLRSSVPGNSQSNNQGRNSNQQRNQRMENSNQRQRPSVETNIRSNNQGRANNNNQRNEIIENNQGPRPLVQGNSQPQQNRQIVISSTQQNVLKDDRIKASLSSSQVSSGKKEIVLNAGPQSQKRSNDIDSSKPKGNLSVEPQVKVIDKNLNESVGSSNVFIQSRQNKVKGEKNTMQQANKNNILGTSNKVTKSDRNYVIGCDNKVN